MGEGIFFYVNFIIYRTITVRTLKGRSMMHCFTVYVFVHFVNEVDSNEVNPTRSTSHWQSPGTDCVRDSVLGGQVINSHKDCPKNFNYWEVRISRNSVRWHSTLWCLFHDPRRFPRSVFVQRWLSCFFPPKLLICDLWWENTSYC